MTQATTTLKADRAARKSSGSVSMKYDAAQTTPQNARHWLNADGLSPTSSNSEAVRKTLRDRSRYEISNNPYAKGLVDTIADDTVGTGPRIQVRSGKTQTETDKIVEYEFTRWAKGVDFCEKIRLGRKSKLGSGEVFFVLARGAGRPTGTRTIFNRPGVELGLQIIEADQVATPTMDIKPGAVSGIEFDRFGNPSKYHILKKHPGETLSTFISSTEFDRVPASMVLHYFDRNRPGDARGIPELTPALELLPYMRRLTLATVHSAEHIANIAGMLHTDAPADGDAEEIDTLDTIDIVRGEMMVLPEGWKFDQARAEQPTATYVQFMDSLIGQVARALNVPFNIAAGNSSSYNYASGRLDHQGYAKTLRVERSKVVGIILDPTFDAWFDEATLVRGLLPAEARTETYRRQLRTTWFFDGAGHVDPVKEANGQKIRLENGTTSLAIEAAKEGLDWRDLLDQQLEEQEYRAQIGLESVTQPGNSSASDTAQQLQDIQDKLDQKVQK